MMKKKNSRGFSIPELLAVIVIMGILVTIATVSYNGISRSLKQKTYDNKISLIKTKAIEYAMDNKVDVGTISVATLLQEGYLDMDANLEDEYGNNKLSNPLGGYLDCYKIDINKYIDDYDVDITNDNSCELAELAVLSSKLDIEIYADKGDNLKQYGLGKNKNTEWTNKDVYLFLNPKALNDNKLSTDNMKISWLVNGDVITYSGSLASEVTKAKGYANIYKVSTLLLFNGEVTVKVETIKGVLTKSVDVKIDKESPKVNLSADASFSTSKKRIIFNGNDGSGSGFNEYAYALEDDVKKTPIFKYKSDNGSNYVDVYENKTYYAYAKDKAGNVSDSPTEIKITNIDNKVPVCNIPAGQEGWSRSYTYTYGCRNDVGSGCATPSTTETITTDTDKINLNWNIKDNIGNNETCSTNLQAHVDVTAPTCQIVISNNSVKGENNWYTSDVEVNLVANDNLSGIAEKGLSTSSSEDYNGVEQIILRNDTERSGITYYGYVKDKAGNTNRCELNVKRLAEKPICVVNAVGGNNGTEWYVSDVNTSVSSVSKYVVSTKIKKNNNYYNNYTVNYNTAGETIVGEVRNDAGTTNTCTKYIKRDADAPDVDFTFQKTRENYECDTYKNKCNDVEAKITIKGSVSGVNFAGVSDHSSSKYIGSAADIDACVAKYTNKDNNNGAVVGGVASGIVGATAGAAAAGAGAIAGAITGGLFDDFSTSLYRSICMMQTYWDKSKWVYNYYDSPHTFVQEGGQTETYYAKVCSNAKVCKEVLAEITTPEPKQEDNSCGVLTGIVGGAGAGYVAGNILAGFLGPVGFLAGLIGGAIVGGVICALS